MATDDGRYLLALDGRLDHREELLRALDGRSHDPLPCSDARLATRAYVRWGEGCFGRLLGPFAIAIHDRKRHRLICGRDPMGDRSLLYRWDGHTFLGASEEQALLAYAGVSNALDEETVARFFALWAPRLGATFFADLRELPPGHYLTLEDGVLELHRYWETPPASRLRCATDADYQDRFRQLLFDSVRSRMRGSSVPAVLMSGGLDSTSVAAAAAVQLRPERLRTVSWVFDELVEQDERRYMEPMIEEHGLEAIRLPGDDAWPLSDLDTWLLSPNAPGRDLYRLRERAYAWARQAGHPILLTGDFGDNLFCGYDFWLRDLLAEGRITEALKAARPFFAGGSAATSARMAKSLIRVLGWRGRRPRPPHWLTPPARDLVGNDDPLPRAAEALRPDQYRAILDPVNAHAATLEQSLASRMGIELRFPFRDRRLVDLVLRVPAHQIYRPGWYKWLLRQAMRGLLPEAVRRRRDVTSLLPLCARGLVEKEERSVAALIASPDAIWPRYVRSRWLRKGFPDRLRAGVLSLETVVAWRCICMELWRTRAVDGATSERSATRHDLMKT